MIRILSLVLKHQIYMLCISCCGCWTSSWMAMFIVKNFNESPKTPCKLLPTLGIVNFKRRIPLHLVVNVTHGKYIYIPPNYKKVHKSPKTLWRRIEVNLYGRVLFYTYYWNFWPCLMKCSSKVKNHSIIHDLQIKNSKKILSILTSTKMFFWYLFMHDTFGSKCFII
jgi:hypothetical protein